MALLDVLPLRRTYESESRSHFGGDASLDIYTYHKMVITVVRR